LSSLGGTPGQSSGLNLTLGGTGSLGSTTLGGLGTQQQAQQQQQQQQPLVQQQIMALVNSPYGSSPLFRNMVSKIFSKTSFK
jgi:hypothetical protein